MPKPSETNPLLLFASAFSLGAVFAYFASDAGKRKWEELQASWEDAKAYLVEQGLIQDTDISLEDFRREYLTRLGDSFMAMKVAFEQQHLQKELSKLAKLKRRKQQHKQRKGKFKGV